MLNAYETYYQLSADPFRLNPDHNFSYGHRTYARAKAYLTYALHKREGFVIVTGGAGTGKTTLINEILAELDNAQIQVASLTTARLVSLDLLHMVAISFGLHPEKMDKVTLLTGLEHFLIEQNQKGWRTILIVDEAQGLSHSGVEELRLLANLQFNNQLLLQIFLVGQERLVDLIRGPSMEQLRQRIIAASRLEPLDLDETVTYVEQRLFRAGWRGDPKISEDALRLIHAFSGGIPRRINLICSRLFLYGSLEGKHDLTGQDARDVIEDLRRELLLIPEASDAAEAYQDMMVTKRGGQVRASDLPRAESFKLFEQSRRRSEPQDLGTSPVVPVRTAEKRSSVAPGTGKDTGDLFRESADTLPPGIYVEPDAETRTGRILGVAASLLVAGVIGMAVMRPDIRESLIATHVEEKGSIQQRLADTSGTDNDDHALATDVGKTGIIHRDSGDPRELRDPAEQGDLTKGQNGTASTRTLQTVSPGEVETSAEDQPSVALALEPDRIGNGSDSRALLTTTSEPEQQRNTHAAPMVAEETMVEDRSGQRKEAEQPRNRQLTQSGEGSMRFDLQERASGEPSSQSDAEIGRAPEVSAETSSRLPASTGPSSITAPRPKAAEDAKTAPPVVSQVPTVIEHPATPPVPTARRKTTVSVPDKPPAPAGTDAPVLIAKATPSQEEKTPIKGKDQLKSVLLEGKWKSRGKPAVLLPSDITFCKTEQDRINCWSIPQNIDTKYGKALYKVEGTLQNFSAEGDFQLSYRTLVRLARDNGANQSGNGGWQITEHAMSCNLTQPENVRCRDEKGVTRDYRRLGPVL